MPPLHGGTAPDLRPGRPGHRRARSVGLCAPVPRRAPGRDHPLLRRPPLAGHDGPVSAAGRADQPPHADEHLPRQVAGIPGRARPRRRHPASRFRRHPHADRAPPVAGALIGHNPGLTCRWMLPHAVHPDRRHPGLRAFA
ncbi:hypothetical protein G6F63_014276 [Rhizopus arrhizus]|nr:hypothetical protein G6F63_014276 [Rhizopus arrhizus]